MLEPIENSPDEQASSASSKLAWASYLETAGVVSEVILPTLAKGVLIRRPRVVRTAERFGFVERAIRRMQRLRDRHGGGPVVLAVPGKTFAVLLAPELVERVLAETPEPFATATAEKRAALAHFEPGVSLISQGTDRVERRAFNERVLESETAAHTLAGKMAAVIENEVASLLSWTGTTLRSDEFFETWRRVVRRIVLGDSARDDHAMTAMLARLRAAGNWAMFHPGRRQLLHQLHDTLNARLSRAEPGSLAAHIATTAKSTNTRPTDQVAHWLFASEPTGIAIYRALALLAAHPEAMQMARRQATEAATLSGEQPLLRSAMLESLRLWPTTPLILRGTTSITHWPGGDLPQGASLIIYAPFFHRDDATFPDANRFAPHLWLGNPPPGGRFVQFSQGPGTCPGRNLVLMVSAMVLAAIIRARDVVAMDPKRLDPARPLPGTLAHHTLQFRLRQRANGAH